MDLYGLERDVIHSDADNLTAIPVLLRRVLVEIALVWFEQGNDDFSFFLRRLSSGSPMTMGTLLLLPG